MRGITSPASSFEPHPDRRSAARHAGTSLLEMNEERTSLSRASGSRPLSFGNMVAAGHRTLHRVESVPATLVLTSCLCFLLCHSQVSARRRRSSWPS
jgi:hypothetical protein